jgi:acetyl-CoA acyltransferase 2
MTSKAVKNLFIVGAKRTPFGAFGGKLKEISATDLAVLSSKAALAQANVAPELVDESIFGNVISSSLDGSYLARHIALKAGLPIKTPALTANRLCGSGFETVTLAAEAIELGRANIILCGGTENMSQTPLHISGLAARWGTPLGKGLQAEDALWAGLSDSYAKLPMGLTAEKLGAQFGITREQCDEFALRSQNLTEKAYANKVFDAEIAPVDIKGKKGPETVAQDEHPRKGATIADLKKLKPVFKPDGLVTAGSASGICDGAASLVVTDDKNIKAHNLKPLSRLVSWSRVGCDPSIMGIGPVDAIKNALQIAGLSLNQIDLIEINEAFAAQYLACEKALGLDPTKCNTNGGAIAIGHPLGASGARILTHLSHELIRTNKRYAVGAACIGGGQGIAVVLENATL